jgi:osmoprotectant transport system ATP-binding protein
LITLQSVGKSFGAVRAIDGVSLVIEPGELLALVGPSGSGKSTLLRLMNRLVEPDEGDIHFQGRPIRELEPVALRRRIGYAIQSIGLFPHWTVARNIATVPELLGWPRARIDARVDELLGLFGLDPAQFRPRWPHELSGGQQQRVGVARALAADPDLLLMDEPFGALDPVTRAALQAELARVHRRSGKTIVLVTHDVGEAERLANRVAMLDGGRLRQVGAPSELRARPVDETVRRFFSPSPNWDTRAALGLQRLDRTLVRDRMRPGAAPDGSSPGASDDPVGAGVSLADASTLSEALAVFLAGGQDRLPVVDAGGRRIGMLHVVDLLQPPAADG